jgi:(p)ppGpp synthase/HD superfamily hydrolase
MITKFKIYEGLVKKAHDFSKEAHKGVYRRGVDEKGNKVEYFEHPKTVAEIVKEVKQSTKIKQLIAAAYLHDTVQDTEITLEDIKREFGKLVMKLVKELTSDDEQLKLKGKEQYLTEKFLSMTSWALVIKLADRLHNVKDVPKKYNGGPSDKRWAIKYALQTYNILNKLKQERRLSNPQTELVKRIEDKIKIALQ